MIKFLIDIFCKDTIVGLSQFENIRSSRIFKSNYSSLFYKRKEAYLKKFIDPTAYHL